MRQTISTACGSGRRIKRSHIIRFLHCVTLRDASLRMTMLGKEHFKAGIASKANKPPKRAACFRSTSANNHFFTSRVVFRMAPLLSVTCRR